MFSVVIPTIGRDTLHAAIESVYAQGVEVELLVELDVERTGPAATRNRALTRATQPYVAFLDDDDRWLPGRLSDAMLAHEAGADIVVASTRIVTGANVLDDEIPITSGVTIRRDIAPKFDERYRGAEDAEWLLRVARAGATFATVRRDTLVYAWPDGPRDDHLQRIEGSRMLIEDHADWFAQHPRAAAYRWERYGRMQLWVGNLSEARYGLRRALRRPSAWKPYTIAVLRTWRHTANGRHIDG